MAKEQCALCRRPALNGSRFCALHVGDPSAEKTQLVALDSLGVPVEEQAPTPPATDPLRQDTSPSAHRLSAAKRPADTDPTALLPSGAKRAADTSASPPSFADRSATEDKPPPHRSDAKRPSGVPPGAHPLSGAKQPADTSPYFPVPQPEKPHPDRTEAAQLSDDAPPARPRIERAGTKPPPRLAHHSSPDSVPTLVPPSKPQLTISTPSLPYPRPRKPNSAVGRLLGGRFEVRVHLGSGAFGTTYVAWDTRLRRDCVVKILRPLSADPSAFEIELRKRFSNEALALAHLIHPNITQVFDSGEEPDGATWIAMEFVRGRSLAEIQREQGRLDPMRLARLGAQVASALAFAHSRGIVHRDLKPDNLLVVDHETSGEQVKVLDFGVARITDPQLLGMDQAQANLTGIGAFLGTPAFMSPEQAEGTSVTPASDVYSLGVVLFLLVTGKLPGTIPEAWTPLTTIAFVMSAAEPVRSVRPDCPEAFAEIIDAMLVKDPHERRLTATQIEDELHAIEPTTFQRSPVAVAAKPKRNISLTVTVGALVVAAGAVAALLVTRHQFEKPAGLPVARAVEHPAAADPRAALREATIVQVLHDAEAGKPSVVIDPEADALAKGGDDARLEYAKGLAHLNDQDYDSAVVFFTQAAAATDPKLARKAADELEIARAKQAQASAQRPKPKLRHQRRKTAAAPTTALSARPGR